MSRSAPELRWDLTVAEGNFGESLVADVLGLAGKTVEVKTKSYLDAGFYLEFQCQKSWGWEPSGVQTTRADYWVWVVGRTGVMVVVPTATVRRCYTRAQQLRLRVENGAAGGDHPTHGYVIPIQWFWERGRGQAA